MKKNLTITAILLAFTFTLGAQEEEKEVTHFLSLKPQFSQIKDQFNYGLSHSGANLVGEYLRVSSSDTKTVTYEAELGFGANYNQGIGMNWILKPLDFYYGFRLSNRPKIKVTLGPYVAGYYMWQLYPELQSGHMFWLSSYELGPRVLISLPVKNKFLNISVSNSVVSMNSRPEQQTEQYYYSLTMADFAKNPHTNLSFGSQDIFNHIDIGLKLSDPKKRFSLGYEFEYFGYLDTPKLEVISHSIKLTWAIGNRKNN